MRPIIGITMGDAAGIGPEVIVKALSDRALYESVRPLVIGDAKVLEKAAAMTGRRVAVRRIVGPGEGLYAHGAIDCIDLDLVPTALPYGTLSAAAGDAAFRYVERAVKLAMDKKIHAICTAPLNKEALRLAGHHYPGHTEILAALTGTSDYAMMLSAPHLKVIHLTTHVGLIEAIGSLNPERTYRVIKMAHETLRSAGTPHPSIGVCGINPHAGENGLFGNGEEREKLIPGIERARLEGINATGPHPADTLFYRAVRGEFDIVVACYHDQGHIPIKVMGLEVGVNITIGLKYGIVRTSVDHGTAYDIAGQNRADERSMKAAIAAAAALSPKSWITE
jgi:4-hydroxythreonine-4-phosphate dehydrogenase